MDLKREKKFGLQKGIKQNQIQIVKSMLKKNMDINEISEITGNKLRTVYNIIKRIQDKTIKLMSN